MTLEVIDSSRLQIVALTYAGPHPTSAASLATAIDDFGVLYRMSTGTYGRLGYADFNTPFPYARPYVDRVGYGSPFDLHIVVPTVFLLGGTAKWTLPALLDLVQT